MDLRSLLARLPIARFKHPPPVVGVLRLSGIIGGFGPLRSGMTLAGLETAIERAFKLPRLEAVALSVNSPGGSPAQSDLICRRIRDLAEEKEVRVFAFCEDVAASGGYWLACAAAEIYARETSIVGSIGVISAGFGFPELLQRLGIERRIHTAGDKKSMLDPFQAEKPKDVARLKGIQKDLHDSFQALVRERRGERLKGGDKALFGGEFWTGRKAVELGLIDGIGELRQVMRARYGDKVVLKRLDAPPWWRRRFGLAGLGPPPRPEPRDWVTGLLAAVEERALWSRFGL
ncbi:MAG: S49 family peptidase [Proteobacteria bacterium]|nr:S49 family peptidase [Pseudomonadota bacterium]